VTTTRALTISFVAMALGVVFGWTLPRKVPAPQVVTGATSPPTIDACRDVRNELTSTRGRLAICEAYARHVEPTPAPTTTDTALAKPSGMDALLIEAQKVHAWAEASRELIYLRYRDGAIRAYRPEDGPPDAGDLEGAKVIMHKLPDGVVEQYDPRPETVRLYGPPGPDGLYTHPDGTRVRFVFTDAGAR
jgi:hypothetical protein